jgi:hypothetical protein
MYGNNFDYTGTQPSVDRDVIKQIMEDTRKEVSLYNSEIPDVDMGAKLEAVGVGNVGDYLNEAYTPFLTAETPSYADHMAGTPGRMADALATINAGYEAGKPARTASFQSILNDVNKFTYGDADAFDTTNTPAAPAASAASAGPAAAELDALKIKRVKALDGKPLDYFTDTFGKSFSLNDYDRLLAGGQGENVIQDRINQYAKVGGKFGAGVKQMDFFEPRPTIGSFMKGSGFGQQDKKRAKEAGYSNAEIRDWKQKTGN